MVLLPHQNIPCGIHNEMPDIWSLKSVLKPMEFMEITEMHRFFVDLKRNVMVKYADKNQDPYIANLDLRIKYLTNEIDKEQFKRTLFARNKKINKYKTVYENLDMLYNVGVDIFNRFRYNLPINVKKALEELDNIRIYYNITIKKTKERYDCKSLNVSKITKEWKFIH